jgi:hypothetical protein
MQWSDLKTPPTARTLRQFAATWLVVLGGIATSRLWRGQTDFVTAVIAVAAAVVGFAGLIRPGAVRVVYTAAMIVTFPIGWVVSKAVLALLFFLLFTPIAVVFRLVGRDALGLRRRRDTSFWTKYPGERKPEDYLRPF